MLDFGALPPEINSARIYAGPGAGSMLAAAAAWQELAAELNTTAASYGSVVSGLTGGSWTGPSSASMAAAVSPYVTWLSATAAQAEQTANQVNAAAVAFETAFAATVPPPLIAANRSLQSALIATNFLGQNTPAIVATEAHYLEMWAQDAAAMYGYAAASSAATQVTPFTSPPQTTNPTGLADQAAAVAQAAGTSAGTHAETLMSAGPQLISATPQALQALASPAGGEGVAAAGSSGASSGSGLSSLSGLSMLTMPLRMLTMPLMMLSRLFMMGGMGGANGLSSAARAAVPGVAAAGTGIGTALSGGLSSAAGAAAPASVISIVGGGQAATAGLGQATSVGALSVPPAWAGFGSTASPAAAVLASTSTSTAPVTGMGQAAMPPMMPITNMAARGAIGPASQYDFRPNLIPRSPAGG